MTSRKKGNRVLIVGGGASGMCAAVLLARRGCEVTLLEKGTETGKKLSMTGNGRCNLSNLRMEGACYNEEAQGLVSGLLSRYGVGETVAFFRSIGVLLRSEEGYLYPVAGEAPCVVRALNGAMKKAGVTVVTSSQVKDLKKEEDRYLVTAGGSVCEAEAVLLACGAKSGPKSTHSTGDGYYLASQCGLRVRPVFPALVRLRSDDPALPQSGGVRVFAEITFYADSVALCTETGEIQLTKDGLSGIPVLQGSACCAQAIAEGKTVSATLNLFPGIPEEQMEEAIAERVEQADHETLREFLNGFSHRLVNEMVCAKAGFSPEDRVRETEKARLFALLRGYRSLELGITAAASFFDAQATRGGVAVEDLTKELEAKMSPGLFCAGELVDVDGRCGGYNLQWAWTSAMAASDGICRRFGI